MKEYCEVVYLPRTEGISTTKIKEDLGIKLPTPQVPQPKQTSDVPGQISIFDYYEEETQNVSSNGDKPKVLSLTNIPPQK